jgi:hypothetical protein
MASATAALHQFLVEPIKKKSPALFFLQLAQLLNDRAGGRYDGYVQSAVSSFKPKMSFPPSRLMDGEAIANSVNMLRARGWDILPWRFPAEDIASLRDFAFSTPAYADDPSERISITANNIPRDRPRYIWRMADLARLPAVQGLMADSALHQIAQEYIGCRPVLTTIALWLDPIYAGKYEAHVYHYDNDGPAFLKYFIYLNDVTVTSGAHAYIQSSHHHRKPEKFSRATRYDRDDLLNHYGADNEIIFASPAGTVLAEDTAGFHKGTTPSEGYRLLLQLQYAMLDIPHLEELSGCHDRVHVEGLDDGIRRIGRKFFK